jgi:hypothetical protein
MFSILDTIKERLGVANTDDSFDSDIIDEINSQFADLSAIGVGPLEGFAIEDSSSIWEDFVSDIKILNSVKDFVYIGVKLVFDPPTQSALLTSLQNRYNKLEWRLHVLGESIVDTPPTTPSTPTVVIAVLDDAVLDLAVLA